MGDILLASSSPEEWGIFNHTFIKATHLPHESVGGGAPPFLPLPRLLCPRLGEVGEFASADDRGLDIASVGGACCDPRVVFLPPTRPLPSPC